MQEISNYGNIGNLFRNKFVLKSAKKRRLNCAWDLFTSNEGINSGQVRKRLHFRNPIKLLFSTIYDCHSYTDTRTWVYSRCYFCYSLDARREVFETRDQTLDSFLYFSCDESLHLLSAPFRCAFLVNEPLTRVQHCTLHT